MRRALEAAGLPSHFGLYSLRHTFGSGLILALVSPAYVLQPMGHTSIQQTVDAYGSWLPIHVPGAVDALADATAPDCRGHQADTLEVFEAGCVSVHVQRLVLVLLVPARPRTKRTYTA